MAITGYTKTIFTNVEDNGKEPVTASFLNNLQDALINIDASAVTQAQVLELIKNNSASREYVNNSIANYREPWNLNENVGRININTSNSIGCSATTKYGEVHTGQGGFSIPMINSGNLTINFRNPSFSIYGSSSGWDAWTKYAKLEILHNNTIIKELVWGTDFFGGDYEEVNISLNVQKNDKIMFKSYIEVRESDAAFQGSVVTLVPGGINLYANIDTPYKYIDIPISSI